MNKHNLRWYIIGLIGISTVINFIDRSALNIMWPYIYKNFGIADESSKKALALITTSFLIAYAIGQIVAGRMMDKTGTRRGMVYAIGGWSIAIAMHAVAATLTFFSFCRFWLGFTEAGNWPGATKTNAEWFPASERAIAQGIFGASTAIGNVVAGPIVAILFTNFGWRITFLSLSLLGLLWIVPWLKINKPQLMPDSIAEEATGSTLVLTTQAQQDRLRTKGNSLLSDKNVLAILAARFLVDPIWWLFIVWMPTFLKEQFHYGIRDIAAFSWMPYLFAAIGGVSGGLYANKRLKKNHPPVKTRLRCITIGCLLMLMPLLLFTVYFERLTYQPTVVMLLISLILFGFQFLISNLQTLPSDCFPSDSVGRIAGLAGSSAVVGTICCTWAVPFITNFSYRNFFVLALILVPLTRWSLVTISSRKSN